MLPYVLRRVGASIPLLLASSFLSFILVANAGDPLEPLRQNPNISQAAIDRKVDELNLDKPVLVRYVDWLGNAVQGDLGNDNTGSPVFPQLRRAMGVTARLIVVAVALAVAVAIVIGALSALRQYSWFDNVATLISFVAFSLPVFWLAVLLKEFVAIPVNDFLEDRGRSRWLATVFHQTPDFNGSFLARVGDWAGHLALPALTLVLVDTARFSRFVRSSMLDVMTSDYIRTARAKGLARRKVITRHGLRNALMPVTTIASLNIGALLGGAIVTETVFQWQGMGQMLVQAVKSVDVNLMQAWLLASAVIVIAANLIADLLYAVLDPRIRLDQ